MLAAQATRLGAPLLGVTTQAAGVLARLTSLGAVSALDRALWLLGRAYNAALPRDVLLDAVVGLESLLVPGPGEAAYRFALHGTAILAADHKVHDDLRKIYHLRSSAAHAGTADDFSSLAPRARQLLAHVVFAIVDLIDTKAMVIKGTAPVGKAVQTWVQELVIDRARRNQ